MWNYKKIREDLNLSIKDIAEQGDYSYDQIINFECGIKENLILHVFYMHLLNHDL